MATTILLVEDEHGLADSIATELGFINYQVKKLMMVSKPLISLAIKVK